MRVLAKFPCYEIQTFSKHQNSNSSVSIHMITEDHGLRAYTASGPSLLMAIYMYAYVNDTNNNRVQIFQPLMIFPLAQL